ncbi:hypothetical protein JCM16303_001031 [Sporobolomyces ruberrimus]
MTSPDPSSDSDSGSSVVSGKFKLNEVISKHPTKPSSSPEGTPFSHNGKQYRSIGVFVTPELTTEAARLAAKKPDRFASLPDNVVELIIDWTGTITLEPLKRAIKAADRTDTGWISSTRLSVLANYRRERHRLFRQLTLVSRRFYHLCRPRFYRKVDTSILPTGRYRGDVAIALCELMDSRPRVALPVPAVKRDDALESESESKDRTQETTQTPKSTSADGPPPKKKKKVARNNSIALPTNESLPTFGELVETFVCGSSANCINDYTNNYADALSNLQHLFLSSRTNLSIYHLQQLASNATYQLRTVDHLFLDETGENNDTRVEAIISLFNAAPNLERFGVSGNLKLDELRGKRLAFVWRLNARLKHAPTGSLGVGLKQVYFGAEVELPVSFLRSLKESCPRLKKLHLVSGVKVAIDATPLGGTPFDLAAFAAQWSSLTALSLVGTSTFNTTGTFDAILKVCSSLTHLHLRSDHITYAFFASITNDFAIEPLPAAVRPSARLQIHQLGSETAASAALVEASKRNNLTGSTGLRHPITNLTITFRLKENETILGSKIHVPGCTILPISLLLLSFQARGLGYPNEMGGQRDLLSRAALMINLEHKKKSDAAAKEREEQKKKKELEQEKQGKGKGKEQPVEEEIEPAQDEVVVPDIEIVSEA